MNRKLLVFGMAAVLAVVLLALLLSRGIEKPAQEAIDAQPSFGQPPSESSQQSQVQQAKPLGNISFQSIKSNASINATIDSSQKLDSGNLLVKFHHASSKEEPVSVVGAVRYELSKAAALPNEEVTLTVFDWSTEYFEIKVRQNSSVFGFGRKTESLDNDEVVLKELTKQGIDKKDVVLEKDYGRRLTKAEKDAKKAAGDNSPDSSPFSKIYKDTKSGKNILVASGLPMVDDVGMPIDVGWELKGNKFVEKNNLFKATVSGNNVELIVKNDQPDGRKKNDQLAFQPQLFLDGVEQTALDPTLLAIDPVNPNYQNNVLEWDYGIAKRRLRLIEGKVLGSWVFASNPNGEVRIKYNQVGDYRLKLGQYANGTDEEMVPASVFNSVSYPFTVSDSATYNPDANPETTSVDGVVWRYVASSGELWSSIITGAGTNVDDTTYGYPAIVKGVRGDANNKGTDNNRAIFLFDTSGLSDTATVTASTLSIYGWAKNADTGLVPNINIYTSTPASNTGLVAADYTQIGSTAQSTAISYSDWSTTGYNNFALNDMTKISLTSVSKFGSRNVNYDVDGGIPPFAPALTQYHLYGYFSEQGDGYKPKLVVTYNPLPLLLANGEVCTANAECLSNKCRLGPNTATKYCTDAAKTCGQSGGAGYDTGNEVSNDECQSDGAWLCNGGYYNPSGSCTAAGAGYYSAEDSDSRAQCSAGYYGSSTTNSVSTCNGQCTAGYYCPSGSTSTMQNECGLGNYCPTGSGSATACPAGTYGSSTTLTTSSCTGQCSAGYYGSSTGQTSSTCNGLCTVGYYCLAGSTSSIQNACPAGMTSNPGAASIDDCYLSESLQWTSYSSGSCNIPRSLYCFEK